MGIAKFFLIGCLLGASLDGIQGHGMLMDPISRSSAWRKSFDVEPDYNDNELFCGGYGIQYEQNEGKCGECGDDYAMLRPRPHENGGIYGTGVIVRNYTIGGEIINVRVKLTANHKGTFAFHLCPLEHPHDLETEECFNRHPLELADGGYDVEVPSTQMDFTIGVRLPTNVVCDHCVFRWSYRAGNNWGLCDDGRSSLGCGPQETFRNCADISIRGSRV
ncbi:unnamed protein product [Xylocopa violacea]|uniref:Chitin-binding type-4 domain-containing protein n=1 Tax=Xylocopa violacea TaxID=135666 RepID=A0ABP1PIR5_XYLVO